MEPKTEFDQQIDRDSLTVIQSVQRFRQEADEARISRLAKNSRNREVFLGRQDFSGKLPGQSREFLPKVAVSVEQMAAVIKRGLVSFGDWFSCDVDNALSQVISGQQLVPIINSFLQNLWDRNNATTNFATVASDAVKVGLLESLMILKVHGGMMPFRRFKAERGEVQLDEEAGTVSYAEDRLETIEDEVWHLRIDLVRPEDYYPDPTGNRLYEIHRVERDLHEVVKMAEDGIYDMAAVRQMLDTDYPRPLDEERSASDVNQDETTPVQFRKRCYLDEFWGTLLRDDGTIYAQNIVCTVANDKYLIRKPEPNPFWHQESPFVVSPLVRVPWSVWHKALYDHASDLNLAINEMFNLMLDGGMAAVWGVKQVRLDDLEDPGQVSGGISQGATLAVKSTLPHDAKVLEQVTEGDVPQDAMAIFEFLNREFLEAALTNQLNVGALPAKQVRATEIVQAQQSQGVTLDGIIADIETGWLAELLRKAWLTILQNADRLPQDLLMRLTDKKTALLIMRASPAERFALFADKTTFRVSGLSATMARMKDFQKIMAMIQAVTTNPVLFQAFMAKFSGDKTLMSMMKALGQNPNDILMSQEEQEASAERNAEILALQQMMGGAGGEQGGMGGDAAGQPGLQAGVNQAMRPATGMAINA